MWRAEGPKESTSGPSYIHQQKLAGESHRLTLLFFVNNDRLISTQERSHEFRHYSNAANDPAANKSSPATASQPDYLVLSNNAHFLPHDYRRIMAFCTNECTF